jgi:hypothetical protein
MCVYICVSVYAFFYYNAPKIFNSNALGVVNANYYIYYKLYKAFTVYALSVVIFQGHFYYNGKKYDLSEKSKFFLDL